MVQVFLPHRDIIFMSEKKEENRQNGILQNHSSKEMFVLFSILRFLKHEAPATLVSWKTSCAGDYKPRLFCYHGSRRWWEPVEHVQVLPSVQTPSFLQKGKLPAGCILLQPHVFTSTTHRAASGPEFTSSAPAENSAQRVFMFSQRIHSRACVLIRNAKTSRWRNQFCPFYPHGGDAGVTADNHRTSLSNHRTVTSHYALKMNSRWKLKCQKQWLEQRRHADCPEWLWWWYQRWPAVTHQRGRWTSTPPWILGTQKQRAYSVVHHPHFKLHSSSALKTPFIILIFIIPT